MEYENPLSTYIERGGSKKDLKHNLSNFVIGKDNNDFLKSVGILEKVEKKVQKKRGKK